MSFSVQTNRTSATGSGSAGQVIPFTFPAGSSSDIVCYKRVTATGVQTTLVETTNYTVSITGDTGGSVTTVTAIETTEQIHVVRATPKTQTLDLEHGGSFSAENVEDALDKQTRIAIDAHDKADRSLRSPETDPTSSIADLSSSIDRKGKFLAFDSDTGAPTVASTTSTDVTISAFAETYLDDADGSTTLTTIYGDLSDSERLAWKSQAGVDFGLDVRDYGAVGDGTTDDATAFQSAIDAAQAGGVPVIVVATANQYYIQ